MVQTFLVALIAAICRSDRPFFGMMRDYEEKSVNNNLL